jgi:surface protein
LESAFFSATTFNQDLGNWNVSKVTTFTNSFRDSGFNNGNSPSISGWTINTTNNVLMNAMFYGSQFNQPIGNWNVSKVTNMTSMFNSTPFNQPIGSWNVSGVTDMESMFSNSTYNQPLSGWNVSNVSYFNNMFGNSIFNQPIGNWNVSKATNMSYMFQYSQFNQPIGNWNISGVTNFNFFMLNKTTSTLSSSNLDNIYNGWVTKNPQIGITITFGSAKHTSGSTANKNILTSTYGWSITDGGVI